VAKTGMFSERYMQREDIRKEEKI